MDLKEGWEKKALLGVGVFVIIISLYVYFAPYPGTPTTTVQNQDQIVPSTVTPIPYTEQVTNNNSSTNNSTSINGNFTLTGAQAQNIALNANQGYSAGSPTQGNVNINGSTHSVWIIPITKVNAQSKTVYVDASSGTIVQSN